MPTQTDGGTRFGDSVIIAGFANRFSAYTLPIRTSDPEVLRAHAAQLNEAALHLEKLTAENEAAEADARRERRKGGRKS